jgi:hypothetical protein
MISGRRTSARVTVSTSWSFSGGSPRSVHSRFGDLGHVEIPSAFAVAFESAAKYRGRVDNQSRRQSVCQTRFCSRI